MDDGVVEMTEAQRAASEIIRTYLKERDIGYVEGRYRDSVKLTGPNRERFYIDPEGRLTTYGAQTDVVKQVLTSGMVPSTRAPEEWRAYFYEGYPGSSAPYLRAVLIETILVFALWPFVNSGLGIVYLVFWILLPIQGLALLASNREGKLVAGVLTFALWMLSILVVFSVAEFNIPPGSTT